MVKLDNLADATAEILELKKRIRVLETAAPVGFTSVTRGALRVVSAEGFIVEGSSRIDGTERVTGTLIVTGTFEMDGVQNLTGTLRVTGESNFDGPLSINGPTEITGATTITGTFQIDGETTITGDVTITGNVELTGDLEVVSTGRIKVGNMTLDPTANGGSITFAGGPEVYASGGELSLYSAGSWVELDGSTAQLHGPGAKWVEVSSSNIRLVGIPTLPQSSVPGSFVGALVTDGSSNIYRIVAG
ncbi:hypothetical protein [Microbacterium sp. E-13]|uniref:hypothetical protein n=1 Tax=Microbacterium sp. E-13 TaxID=3404048 RepID=UPI003CF1DA4E